MNPSARLRYLLLYGALPGLCIVLLAFGKYRFIMVNDEVEFYAGLVAVMFVLLGIWLGLKFARPHTIVQTEVVPREVPVPAIAEAKAPVAEAITEKNSALLSQRELEVLPLLARGLSNQEIADALYVSQNTVKTHLSNIYFKLDVKRRTQAVEKARGLGLLD